MSNCWEFFHSKPVLCSAATCLAWKPAIWINLEYPSDFSLFWRLILLVALPSALAFPQCLTTGVSFGMPSPCFTQLCVLHHVSNGQKPFPKVLVAARVCTNCSNWFHCPLWDAVGILLKQATGGRQRVFAH